ncbi:MAG: glutamate racemase [Candidatus Omnitrophica bacterium]|nr:glutamate racemase [Candidatus Omnitrophota bacterium]
MDTPIGVFDSGIGGLTVVKELARCLPNEDIIYFGDTARVPYGTKSPATIIRFSIENVLFLLKFRVKLVVIACNTSSSHALPVLKRDFKIPIVGVINPGAREAARISKSGRVGVIGTNATIQSGSYNCEIKKINPAIKVYSGACPLFVSLVEEGWLNDDVTYTIAGKYLKSLKEKKVDTLILGCTHYPLLKGVIKDIMGDGVTLVDSAKRVTAHVKDVLIQKDLLSENKKKGECRFYVSDEPARFAKIGERFLGQKIRFVKKAGEYV